MATAGVRNIVLRFSGDTRKLEQASNKSTGALKKFESGVNKASKVVLAAAAAAGTAAVKFASDGVKSFLSFDDAMTSSLAIMGDISGPMRKQMEDAARGIAKETRFSADQAAEGYFFLASAGMDAAQAMAALPQVSKFATAGNFDLALATDLATDAQSALGLTSKYNAKNLENLTRVTDVFVKANTLANTSVEQIAAAMTNKAGAALRAANKDIEEGSAVLAAFADQGIKGAKAGESLSILLRDLPTAASKNNKEFEKLGIRILDSDGNMRHMSKVVAELEGGLKGMSDADRAATLTKLGLTQAAGDAVVNLLGTSKAIKTYDKELRAASGTTEDVAAKQLESFAAQWDLAKAKITDFGITVGAFLVPKFADAADWAQRNTGTLKTLGIALGSIAAAILLVNVGLKVYHGVMMVVRAATLVWTGIQWALNAAFLANPLTWIILAIVALIAVIVLIATKTTWFQTAWEAMSKAVVAAAKAVWRFIKEWLWEKGIKRYFEMIAAIIGWVVGQFQAGFERAKRAGSNVVDFVKSIPGRIKDAFAKVADFITAPFRAGFAAVKTAWNNLIGGKGFDIPSWVPFGMGGKSFRFPRFHAGGTIPGPLGREVPILATAGERILSREQAGGPEEFTATVPIDLGEGITRVFEIKLQRRDRVLKRRVLAGAGAAL